MMRATLYDRAAEALLAGEIQHRAFDMQHAAHLPRPPLDLMNIAISRETGTHEHEIGTLLARQLRWQLFDHEIVERIAERMHVPAALIEPLDERRAHWLQETVSLLSDVPVVRESQYVRNLVETTLELGSEGHCVFIGRGASWILPPESTLRVALMAPLEYRIHVVMRELGLNERDAALAVDARDRQHMRFTKAHFCNSEIDPHAFDLVLNTSRLTVEHCVGLIVAAVRGRAERLAPTGAAD